MWVSKYFDAIKGKSSNNKIFCPLSQHSGLIIRPKRQTLKNSDFLDAILWIRPRFSLLNIKKKKRQALTQTQILDLSTCLAANYCQHWHPCVGARRRGPLQFAVIAEEDSVSDSQDGAKALRGAVWNFTWHGETRAADSWEILLRHKSSRLEIRSTARLSHEFSLVDRPFGFQFWLMKALNLSKKFPFRSSEDSLVTQAVDPASPPSPGSLLCFTCLPALTFPLHQQSICNGLMGD